MRPKPRARRSHNRRSVWIGRRQKRSHRICRSTPCPPRSGRNRLEVSFPEPQGYPRLRCKQSIAREAANSAPPRRQGKEAELVSSQDNVGKYDSVPSLGKKNDNRVSPAVKLEV